MANTAATSPTSAISQTGIGTVAWTNPGNVLTSNDAEASVSLGGGQISNWLWCTGFGFSIPAGATITGIVAEYEARTVFVTTRDNSIKLIVNGAVAGNDKADTVNAWTTALNTYLVRGGAADTWGNALTPAIVNASNFGFAISCIRPSGSMTNTAGAVDHVRMTVHYTEAAADTTGPTPLADQATVNSAGNSISINFSDSSPPLQLAADPTTSGFSLFVNEIARGFSISVASLTLTMVPASTIYAGDTVRVQYAGNSNNLKDNLANPALDFNLTLANNSTAAAPASAASTGNFFMMF